VCGAVAWNIEEAEEAVRGTRGGVAVGVIAVEEVRWSRGVNETEDDSAMSMPVVSGVASS
jgi:hypothetical protein